MEANPEKATVEEENAMTFFFQVAYVAVRPTVDKKKSWMGNLEVDAGMGCTNWEFDVAQALTLIEHYSCTENILENAKNDQTTSSDEEDPTIDKDGKVTKKRKRCAGNEEEREKVRSHYYNMSIKMQKWRQDKNMEAKMIAWKKKVVSIPKSTNTRRARDRANTVPDDHMGKHKETPEDKLWASLGFAGEHQAVSPLSEATNSIAV